MAQDKVKIANLALRKIGAKRISAFTDDTPEARIIDEVYDDIRDEVLAQGIWGFAQKRAALAQLSETIPADWDGVSYVYALPTDFIRLNFYSDLAANVQIEHLADQMVILSNVSGLEIKYTFRNDNPATYFQNFTSALVQRLAAEICFPLTQAVKKAEALQNKYDKDTLPMALSTDSQQGTPAEPIQGEWECARNMAGSGMVARPGSQVWHPFY